MEMATIIRCLLNEALDRFSKADIPMEYSVLVEKWINPVVICDVENVLEDSVEINWYNSSGNLHSINDMPSKISFNYQNWLEVEWHKNGKPYRKNFKFNKLLIHNYSSLFDFHNSYYNGVLEPVSLKNKPIEFQWLNKRGELHSFNDMPALITRDGVHWYNKGRQSRMSYCLSTELPCTILKNGEIIFCKGENDSNETIKFPFSNKYYGHAIRFWLNRYEKYVKWPIRELFTL